jgi:predicted transcriptional regulator
MAARHAYDLDHGWLEDLKIEVLHKRQTVRQAAAALGMSPATAYRLIGQAKTQGRWQ